MGESRRESQKNRRSTICTSSSAARWCRSPATRCRCSTRRASWPSTSTPAAAPGCSTSRIWARSAAGGSSAAAKALETPRARRHPGPGAGQHALHAVHQRRRRHPRRSDGDARRQGRRQRSSHGASMPACKAPGSRASAAPASATKRRGRRARRPRAAGAAGAARRRRAGALAPDASDELHDRASCSMRRHARASSRAPATPARTASRSPSPADEAEQPGAQAAGRARR